MTQHTTISQFLTQHLQNEYAADLKPMLGDIVEACKQIAVAINKGALTGSMGSLASENVQGEVQKALDVITHDLFVDCIKKSGLVAGVVSEEVEPHIVFDEADRKNGQYFMMFDPLDGSSNVNVNISVGTIFSILKAPSNNPELVDFLQTGTEQICAGYALYGTSTMFVFTTGDGVNGFTLDTDANEFYLTHPDMKIPEDTQEFAVNMSNYRFWEEPVQRYVDECLQGVEGPRKKDFNMRWVASMVAEVHRIITRGGVFMYPIDSKIRSKGGKLRLMYEANPMSFIVEQAGGAAITGRGDIVDVKPSGIHQRIAVMMGSKNEVDLIGNYHKRER